MLYQVDTNAAEDKKLPLQARQIVEILSDGPMTKEALLEAMEAKIKSKQPHARILAFYQKTLVDEGILSVEESEEMKAILKFSHGAEAEAWSSSVKRVFKGQDAALVVCGDDFEEHDVWHLDTGTKVPTLVGVLAQSSYAKVLKAKSINLAELEFEVRQPGVEISPDKYAHSSAVASKELFEHTYIVETTESVSTAPSSSVEHQVSAAELA